MALIGTSTLRICGDGHANAIAVNKDFNHLAIAGRSLLKIYSIDQEEFIEICNLRGGKNQNLSFSSNDVAWSAVDSHILATAATNGVVTVWDLSKFGRQKQQFVYSEHERTTHTVTFHGTESHLLFSGSQDGNIKCFDLRLEKAVHTYFCNSESIRDVKFSPQSPNTFAAVSENGTVQLWDLRRPEKCSIQFTAHSGPIYTCDWHPTQPWLATGSRDKLVKIWNTEQKPVLAHTLTTIAVVGKVKWRPDRMYNIASGSLVSDYSVYVWDLRRPFLPYIAFDNHTNVVTGICWKGDDPGVLLSSSKDSTVLRHNFRDASPSNGSQSTSLNLNGDLLFSYKVKYMAPAAISQSRTAFITKRQKPQVPNDQFHLAKSSLINFNAKPQLQPKDYSQNSMFKDYIAFYGCAKEYILQGKPLSELCAHNADVARKYGRTNVCILWRFVQNQYGFQMTSCKINSKIESRSSSSVVVVNQNPLPNRRFKLQNTSSVTPGWGNGSTTGDPGDGSDDSRSIDDDPQLLQLENQSNNTNGSNTDNCLNGPLLKCGRSQTSAKANVQILMQPAIVDADLLNNFMYNGNGSGCIGGGGNDISANEMDLKCLRNGFLYFGAHDISREYPLPDNSLIGRHDLQSAKTAQEMINENRRETSPAVNALSILRVINQPVPDRWEPHQVLADCLTAQTDIGDVQSAVSILIVLGDRRNDLPLGKIVYENWLLAYVEFLHRHQLWNEAAEIMNLSWIRTVYELNQHSTSISTLCGGCGKTMTNKSKWFCNRCKSAHSSKCSVCNRVVTGLYSWCRGCAHGGHLLHLKQWFSNHSKCPKCDHLCEYE